MTITKDIREAYSEIDIFLSLLTDEQINMIPDTLKELFKREKDPDYIKGIDPSVPIEDQNLKPETLALIAFLNLKYWCTDEEEKERLRKVYSQNQELCDSTLQVGYNPEEMFKDKNQEVNEEETQITEYKKETFFKKLFNKITKLFKKK